MKIIDSDAYRVKLADAVEDGYLDADTIETAINILDCEQAIDAVPVVHGRWIKHRDFWECSNCEETISMRRYMEDRLFYCNACGAKMDEHPDLGENCVACGDTKAAAFGDFLFLKPSAENSGVHAYEFDSVRGEYVLRKLTIGNNDGRQVCPTCEKEADSNG